MTLKWHKTDLDCWVTVDGRYSVSYDHLVKTWRSWKLAPGGPWFAPFGRTPSATADEAKAICEGDRK